MANDARYPEPDHLEDGAGSRSFRRRNALTTPILVMSLLVSLVLFWAPVVLVFAFPTLALPPAVSGGLMLGACVLFLAGIIASTFLSARPFRTCSACGAKTAVEHHEGCQFFVCHRCRTYVRGGDFS